ncbi:MAG: hypothetical protein ACHQE6_08595, partial [Solirubrobacterales bacterium]
LGGREPDPLALEPAGQEYELYDYSTPAGRAELENGAGGAGALEEELWVTLEEAAIPHELRAPLPAPLHAAQRRGLSNYQAVEELQDLKAYALRQRNPASPPEPSPGPG